MPRLLLDGATLDLTAETWGQALDAIDRHLAEGHIVTDVRFDGLDEAAFREPGVIQQPLAEFAVVEVTTGTPDSLMQRCLSEAADSIEPLCRAAAAIGDDFRGFDITVANAGLAELADGMSTLIAIAGAASLAAQSTGDAPRVVAPPEHPIGPLAGELTGFIDALLEAQQAQDWITVADILQYDVEPALRRWAPVFQAVSAEPAASVEASA
jgi:hypothetical protein